MFTLMRCVFAACQRARPPISAHCQFWCVRGRGRGILSKQRNDKGAWNDNIFTEVFWRSRKVEEAYLIGYRFGGGIETLDPYGHLQGQRHPATLCSRLETTKQVSTVNSSGRSASSILGRPAKALTFQRNLAHKPDPAEASVCPKRPCLPSRPVLGFLLMFPFRTPFSQVRATQQGRNTRTDR